VDRGGVEFAAHASSISAVASTTTTPAVTSEATPILRRAGCSVNDGHRDMG
jgi:hypothetical protein